MMKLSLLVLAMVADAAKDGVDRTCVQMPFRFEEQSEHDCIIGPLLCPCITLTKK